MTKNVVVTTGNGMFGRALIDQLAGTAEIKVRALVRDASNFDVDANNVDAVVADLDKPASLSPAMANASHVFLVSRWTTTSPNERGTWWTLRSRQGRSLTF